MDGRLDNITHVFLDADDTLWENDVYYRKAEAEFIQLMAPWCEAAQCAAVLTHYQEEAIKVFGYGSKTYLVAMMDAAAQIVPEGFTPALYQKIRDIIVRLDTHRFDFIEGAERTVRRIAGKYTVIIATKGELSEQMRKWRLSGLEDCVSAIEVMETKSEKDYRNLAVKTGVDPENFFMVGNAVRSDIAPVIAMGGWAVHVPYKFTWAHELMELPKSDRIFEIKNISELENILL